ncbi:MAG: nuclease-related domain-containing protein [Candidatus Thalassarchaeaceae archaeon]|nr:nuclease-related domain-containing protein [Candidatus Thalassarchaeaceae archaeon]
MGWLANYRWIRSLNEQQYPSEDTAKKLATMKEKKAMKKIRALPDVIEVYHAKRLTEAKASYSRREIDLVVLKRDRIVLVEIKNYAGTISMIDDTLYQNGKRRWSFVTLSNAKKRLVDIMRETGIHLGTGEIHTALALLGSGSADESVNTGHHMTQAAVARSFGELIDDALNIPVSEEAEFKIEQINAIRELFDMCGTWDELVCANSVAVEGDLLENQTINSWRELYQHGRFHNTRGWFFTFLFGPNFQVELTSWNGETSLQSVDPNSAISLRSPGSHKKVISLQSDHLSSFTFGYQRLPKWEEITLMQTPEENYKSETGAKDKAGNVRDGKEKQKLRVGDVIPDATVAFHHPDGVLFQLKAEQKGMYFLSQMQPLEAQSREMIMRVGNPYPVEITKIKRRGKKKLIEVKLLD